MSEWLYYVVDHLNYVISAHETRHEAAWAKERYHDCNDYEIVPVHPVVSLWKTPKQNRNATYTGTEFSGDVRKVKS